MIYLNIALFTILNSSPVINKSHNSPTWLIILIFILGIFGIIVAGYGAKSGFAWRKTIINKSEEPSKVKNMLNSRKSYNWTEVAEAIEQGPTIIGVSFKNVEFNNEIIPLLLLKTNDFSITIKQFKKDLENKTNYHKLIEYLDVNQLKKESIVFYIIEKTQTEKELNTAFESWLSITGAKFKGFNE